MGNHRKLLRLGAALFVTACLLSACAPSDSAESGTTGQSAPPETDYLEISGQLAQKLQGALGPKLMAAMKSGGPEEAIVVCQEVAQDLTKAASEAEPEVTIRRTALRVRNPANSPDALDRKVLESWVDEKGRPGPPEPSLSEFEGRMIVHRPIMTAEICLQCHGSPEEVTPKTAALIKKYYPNDAATGFQSGDLRGAFRIEFANQTSSPRE
jgi:hypothetical protein